MFNDLFMFQTLCSYTRISSLPYSRFLPDTWTTVIFTPTIQTYFMLLLFIRFAITLAEILFSY